MFLFRVVGAEWVVVVAVVVVRGEGGGGSKSYMDVFV